MTTAFISQLLDVFVQTLLPLMLLVGVGLVADRLLRFELRSLTRLNLYILSPALIFSTLYGVQVTLADVARVAGFAAVVLLSMAAVGWTYARLRRLDAATTSSAVLATTFFNGVNLGLPLVMFAYGEEGFRLAAVLIAINSLPHNGFGLFVAARGVLTTGQSLKALSRMPMLYAIVLAVLIRATGTALPKVVFEQVETLGRASIPILLLIIGMELGRAKLGVSLPDVWAVVLLRLLVAPLVAWGAASMMGLSGMLRAVVIVQASMPTAVMPIVFAREFGGNVQFLTWVVVFSTLLSIVSLSVLLTLLAQTGV